MKNKERLILSHGSGDWEISKYGAKTYMASDEGFVML